MVRIKYLHFLDNCHEQKCIIILLMCCINVYCYLLVIINIFVHISVLSSKLMSYCLLRTFGLCQINTFDLNTFSFLYTFYIWPKYASPSVCPLPVKNSMIYSIAHAKSLIVILVGFVCLNANPPIWSSIKYCPFI